MIKKKIIAIIPARGGSKGVPGKNLKKLAGKPLIDHTIEFALNAGVFDRIIISSDDETICERAAQFKIESIKRPSHLAQDTSLVIDALRHVLFQLKDENYIPDYLFLLEPTAPIREKDDLLKAIQALNNGFDCVASFCETDPPVSRIWSINKEEVQPLFPNSNPFLLRQQQKIGYRLTGQYYGMKTKNIINPDEISVLTGKVYPLMTDKTKFVDIDTETDFIIAKQLMKCYEKSK